MAADVAWLTWLLTYRVGRPEFVGAVLAAVLVTGVTGVVINAPSGRPGWSRAASTPTASVRVRSAVSTTRSGLALSAPGRSAVRRRRAMGPGRRARVENGTARLMVADAEPGPLVRVEDRPTPGPPPRVARNQRRSAAASSYGRNSRSIRRTTSADGHIRGAPARGLRPAAIRHRYPGRRPDRRVLPALIVVAVAGLMMYNALDWISTAAGG
jgi:hypothetical protein